MRRSRVAGFAVAAVMGVAGLLYVHGHRFSGGPLTDPSFGGIAGASMVIGEPLSFTEILVDNHSAHQVRLQRIAIRGKQPGTRVRMWVVAHGHVYAEGSPFPPTSRSNLRDPRGFLVPGHARNVQLVAEVTATHRGCVGFEGLTIEYAAGLVHYRREAHALWFHQATRGTRDCWR